MIVYYAIGDAIDKQASRVFYQASVSKYSSPKKVATTVR